VGSIAPWNYPLGMAAWKILPAVAAGNTIVLKPSELTPLTSLLFAEAAQQAGIPDGVINIVTGTGGLADQALVEHPDVDMVSFTGSTAVGRRVAATAAGSVKRVHLELGGKAPFVVFDDADVDGAVAGSLINAGQDCTAATRAYVQRPLFDEFVQRVSELMDGVCVGAADDRNTDMGSLISVRQRDHVAAMVERARAEGAKVVRGGKIPDHTPAAGA
jgi:betaine-aldehyde dehydrogenase